MSKSFNQLPPGRHSVTCTDSQLTPVGQTYRWFLRFKNEDQSTVCLFHLDLPSVKPVLEIVAEKLGLEYDGDVVDALISGALDVCKAIGWTGEVQVQEHNGRFRTFVLDGGDV